MSPTDAHSLDMIPDDSERRYGIAGGWVKSYREFIDHPIFTQCVPSVFKVAHYFLYRANIRPVQWYDGHQIVQIPAGSFITSYAHVAERCCLSVQQVRDAFLHLSRTHFATYKRTHRWTLVTVTNWAAYQALPDGVEHTEEHTVDQGREQARNRQGTTGEEYKKKRILSFHRKSPPGRGTTASLTTPSSDQGNISDEEQGLIAANTALFTASGPTTTPKSHAAKTPDPIEQQFAAWWGLYPRKVGKQAALAAYRTAIKAGASPAELLEGLRRQLPELLRAEPQYRPYPTTWLNAGRWDDEAEPQQSAQAELERRYL
jgi:hypothetical protein